jgi:trk system potassium uptake protein TrkA
MNGHVVIVGGGRVGRHAAEQLLEERCTVTIIERDPEKTGSLSGTAGEVIEGDGSDPDVLAAADPEEADVVAALTNDTEVNLAVCELAREFAPEARTVLRIARDGEQAYGHREIVDDVVYPAAAGADVAVKRITRV